MPSILIYIGVAALVVWLLKKFVKFSGKIALAVGAIIVLALILF